MRCPHCTQFVRFEWYLTSAFEIDEKTKNGKSLSYSECLNCNKLVVRLISGKISYNSFSEDPHISEDNVKSEKFIYPNITSIFSSNDVPNKYLEDYNEALITLSVSAKSSAAMSRRVLQNILREEYKIRERDLYSEISKFMDKEGIPSYIIDAIDAIRLIGNIAAHPTKNEVTGEIVPVNKDEAEWLLEVISVLFDFTFVQPKKLERRRQQLNLKLSEIGKPPMKNNN